MENSRDSSSEDPVFTFSSEQLLASLGIGNISLDGHSTGSDNETDTLDNQPLNYIAQNQPVTTDWNFGFVDLLPALKRPDPNQMPGDVFNCLLKTGNLFDVGALGVQTQPDINLHSGQGAGNWQFHNNTQSLTSLQSNWSLNSSLPGVSSSSPSGNHNNPQFPPANLNSIPIRQQIPFQSNLSPHATEFIPRQYSPMGQGGQEDVNNHLLSLTIDEGNQFQQEQQFRQQIQQNNPRFSHRQANPHYQQQPFTRYNTSPGYQGQRGGGGYRQQRANFQPRQTSTRQQRQYRPSYYGSAEPLPESTSDRILTSVTDTITHLSTNPADFNPCVKRTLRVLKELLVESDILEIAITLIVEQSVANKNFSYTGAKLCQALNENDIRVGEFTAQHCVITHVQTVFDSSLTSIRTTSNELKERHIGLLFFLAELFVNFKIERGISFFGFGVAAIEIMSQLIQYDSGVGPSHENVKNVVNVLKLAGWEMEQNKNAKVKEDVEKLMKDLAYIHLMEEKALPQTKELIGKVFDLKQINWGRGEEEALPEEEFASARAETPPPTTTYNGKSQDTFYEAPPSSDDDEVYLDDESDEVNKFYDQFLNTLPSSQEKH